MTDQDVRDFLQRMATEDPVLFLDLDAEPLARRARRRATRTVIVGAIGAVAAIAVLSAGLAEFKTPRVPAGVLTPAPTGAVSRELVLRFESWKQGYVEVAVYADGRVIWGDQRSYLQMRLSPGGVDRLKAKAVSTGLFEHDLALGLHLRWGDMEVRRGGRSVIVAWGKTGRRVGTAPLHERFVDATPAQADGLIALEAFFRDPLTWALPNDMYVQREVSPFVPTHLWVGWDRSEPDPSRLPSPAREVLTRNLEAALDGSCGVITIAQAQEIADAMAQAGLIAPDDVTDGIEFDMPGQGSSHSLFHAMPALPDESTCK